MKNIEKELDPKASYPEYFANFFYEFTKEELVSIIVDNLYKSKEIRRSVIFKCKDNQQFIANVIKYDSSLKVKNFASNFLEDPDLIEDIIINMDDITIEIEYSQSILDIIAAKLLVNSPDRIKNVFEKVNDKKKDILIKYTQDEDFIKKYINSKDTEISMFIITKTKDVKVHKDYYNRTKHEAVLELIPYCGNEDFYLVLLKERQFDLNNFPSLTRESICSGIDYTTELAFKLFSKNSALMLNYVLKLDKERLISFIKGLKPYKKQLSNVYKKLEKALKHLK